MRVSLPALAGFAALLAPGVALAAPGLTLATVIGDAAGTMKFIMIALVLAAIAAIALTALKVLPGRRLSGGSAFVSALRLGGPLIGLLGASFVVLMMFLGIANAGQSVPMPVLAPGFAEAAMLIFLGLIAGVIGVICHWVIEARIDRTVLGS